MRIKLLFVFILFCSSIIISQSSSWNILQPSGIGTFKHIEVKDNDSIYLLTDSGLYKSNDNGLSWKELSDERTTSFSLCIDTNRIIYGYDELPNHYLNISEEVADTLKIISKHFLGSKTSTLVATSDLKVNTYFFQRNKSYVVVDYWNSLKYGAYYSDIFYNNNQDTLWQKVNYPEHKVYSLFFKDNDTIIVGNNNSTGNNSSYGWMEIISFTFDGGNNWSSYPGLIWNGAGIRISVNSVLITDKNAILYCDSNGIFRLDDFRNTNYGGNYPGPWEHHLSGTSILKLYMNITQTKIYALASNGIFLSDTDGKSWSNINYDQTISNALDFTVNDKGIIYIISEDKIYTSKADLTGIKNENAHFPKEYELFQNYPNPFNPTTTIEYQITKPSEVKLEVFDVLGREIAILVDKKQMEGNYRIDFDGSKLSSGIYFYKITAGDFVQTKKMMLIK